MIIQGDHAIAGHGIDPLLRIILAQVVGQRALTGRIGAGILADQLIAVYLRLCRLTAGLQIVGGLLRRCIGAFPSRWLRPNEAAPGEK